MKPAVTGKEIKSTREPERKTEPYKNINFMVNYEITALVDMTVQFLS